MTKALTTTTSKSVAKAAGGSKALAAFLGKAGTTALAQPSSPIPPAPRTPRVVFALDATASRAATWQRAQRVQAEMFQAMSGRGAVQLASFGGGRFRASAWASDAIELAEEMRAIRCEAGCTQLGDVLAHVAAESRRERVSAAVFVGDTLEENGGALTVQARRFGVLGIPLFIFHEVGNAEAEAPLRAIAAASGGAYARFGEGDPQGDLQPLLGAVAAFAEGGRAALLAYGERSGNDAVRRIGQQLKLPSPP